MPSVDVFAVIGRSSSDDGSGLPARDCAALRASVSAVRVCLELDPPVSDVDDVAPIMRSLSIPPILSAVHRASGIDVPALCPTGLFCAFFAREKRLANLFWASFRAAARVCPRLVFLCSPLIQSDAADVARLVLTGSRYYQWQKVVTAANMAFRAEIFESQVRAFPSDALAPACTVVRQIMLHPTVTLLLSQRYSFFLRVRTDGAFSGDLRRPSLSTGTFQVELTVTIRRFSRGE